MDYGSSSGAGKSQWQKVDSTSRRQIQSRRLPGSNASGPVAFGSGSKSESTMPSGNRFQRLEEDDNEPDELNANLRERWSHPPAKSSGQQPALTPRPRLTLNRYVREYMRATYEPVNTGSWLARPEIPTSAELLGKSDYEREGDNDDGDGDDELELQVNIIQGPWPSKEQYLSAHYELLREDAVAPLRDAVAEVKDVPNMMDNQGICIYENVRIIGMTFTQQGIATRITFSLRRAGKKVVWEQSKRLITGNMVVLTPAKDMFKTICKVAIVAARPLAGVQQSPAHIDLFWRSAEEIEVDPQVEWVMVEARTGYFEAYRHTLLALQKLMREKFPLSEHLINVKREVEAPHYLQANPFVDLTSVFSAGSDPTECRVENVNVLEDWPQPPQPGPEPYCTSNDEQYPPGHGSPQHKAESASQHMRTELDDSQQSALRRILTKRLAIVQGPPGTGKTHVSVVALKAILQGMIPDDPPIIVTAQTNHALDQLLRHIAVFEPDFIRLGGRTLDQEVISKRTLFEIRSAMTLPNIPGGLKGPSHKRIKEVIEQLMALLGPLTSEKVEPLPASLFLKLGLISQDQHDSLAKGAQEWVRLEQQEHVPGDVAAWLGDQLIQVERKYQPEDFGFEVEEVDLEFEQLKELEAEAKGATDEDFDTLRGPYVMLSEPFTGRVRRGMMNQNVQMHLKDPDLWKIPEDCRGLVYRYLQQKAKDEIRKEVRRVAARYMTVTKDLKVGKWEVDAHILQPAKVIGMTTTGLSKYRGLVASLKPRIVLIEEAAETLEGLVMAACVDSLEHLILVGDHKQLRGHCSVQELEGPPYFLGVSMFERLVCNGIEYSMLMRQRRMIPEVRRILAPIYGELEDHHSVLERLPVPGMGGVNSFFFSHNWAESSDSYTSKCNRNEADMIVGFFNYLVRNGMEAKDITVLTFYNGQRKMILRGLKTHPNLQGCYFKVVTVDSYQGEENGIVLLSLVRSNSRQNIGFLEVENRVCVALSRSQRGFYLFGNAVNLCRASMLWWEVVQVMAKDPRRVGFALPLTCTNHGRKRWIQDPTDWTTSNGGCERLCQGILSCGHTCHLKCHPFSDNLVNCRMPCERALPCGHKCRELCYIQPCQCPCAKDTGKGKGKMPSPSPGHSPQRISEGAAAYQNFANGGHVEADANIAAMTKTFAAAVRRQKADDDMAKALFGVDGAYSSSNVSIEEEATARLVDITPDGNGGSRGKWVEMFEGNNSARDSTGEAEVSLLD